MMMKCLLGEVEVMRDMKGVIFMAVSNEYATAEAKLTLDEARKFITMIESYIREAEEKVE